MPPKPPTRQHKGKSKTPIEWEKAPSDDVGWCYAFLVEQFRHKLHLAHERGHVEPCQAAMGDVRREMQAILQAAQETKLDKRQREQEFRERLKPGGDEIDSDNEDDNEDCRQYWSHLVVCFFLFLF